MRYDFALIVPLRRDVEGLRKSHQLRISHSSQVPVGDGGKSAAEGVSVEHFDVARSILDFDVDNHVLPGIAPHNILGERHLLVGRVGTRRPFYAKHCRWRKTLNPRSDTYVVLHIIS